MEESGLSGLSDHSCREPRTTRVAQPRTRTVYSACALSPLPSTLLPSSFKGSGSKLRQSKAQTGHPPHSTVFSAADSCGCGTSCTANRFVFSHVFFESFYLSRPVPARSSVTPLFHFDSHIPPTLNPDARSMYQQPLHPQQTWPGPHFAQGPRPPTLSSWASAPVIPTIQNPPTAAVPHPAHHHSFVPPAPPGVNPQQWQNGRWTYTAPPGGVNSAQPHGPLPPPNLVGWNVPAGWGITPQYYCPPSQVHRQPERSYWETSLSDNPLGLENMHIKCAPSLLSFVP